jgi:hypothetical protein
LTATLAGIWPPEGFLSSKTGSVFLTANIETSLLPELTAKRSPDPSVSKPCEPRGSPPVPAPVPPVETLLE